MELPPRLVAEKNDSNLVRPLPVVIAPISIPVAEQQRPIPVSSDEVRNSSISNFSSGTSKKCCNYSKKPCHQRRMENYNFCSKHILEDPSAPFRQCEHVSKQPNKRCTLPVPLKEDPPRYCSLHKQLLGIIPRKPPKPKASKEGAVNNKGGTGTKPTANTSHNIKSLEIEPISNRFSPMPSGNTQINSYSVTHSLFPPETFSAANHREAAPITDLVPLETSRINMESSPDATSPTSKLFAIGPTSRTNGSELTISDHTSKIYLSENSRNGTNQGTLTGINTKHSGHLRNLSLPKDDQHDHRNIVQYDDWPAQGKSENSEDFVHKFKPNDFTSSTNRAVPAKTEILISHSNGNIGDSSYYRGNGRNVKDTADSIQNMQTKDTKKNVEKAKLEEEGEEEEDEANGNDEQLESSSIDETVDDPENSGNRFQGGPFRRGPRKKRRMSPSGTSSSSESDSGEQSTEQMDIDDEFFGVFGDTFIDEPDPNARDNLLEPLPFGQSRPLTKLEQLRLRREELLRLSRLYKYQFKRMRDALRDRQRKYVKSLLRHHRLPSLLTAGKLKDSRTKHKHRIHLRKPVSSSALSKEEISLPCSFHGCSSSRMLLSGYCYAHILHDPKQKLFTGCNYLTLQRNKCDFPILVGQNPPYCYAHLEIYNVKLMNEAKEKEHGPGGGAVRKRRTNLVSSAGESLKGSSIRMPPLEDSTSQYRLNNERIDTSFVSITGTANSRNDLEQQQTSTTYPLYSNSLEQSPNSANELIAKNGMALGCTYDSYNVTDIMNIS